MFERGLVACLLFPLVLSLSAAGCSASDSAARESASGEATAQNAQAIVGGPPTSNYQYSVGICQVPPGTTGDPMTGNCKFQCSGTLIAPNLVLSVHHCIADAPTVAVDCKKDQFGPPRGEPGSFWVTTNPTTGQALTGWYRVKRFIKSDSPYVCGADIALLVLDHNVESHVASPAEPAIEYPLTDRDRYSTTLTAIGFGETGPSRADYGVRRIRQSIAISCMPEDPALQCPGQYGTTFVDKEFLSTGGGCGGDSGSGAFEQVALNAGKGLVIGVLARGDTAGGCAPNAYTRLDRWAPFMAAAGKLAAQMGGYDPPKWTQIPNASLPQDPTSPFPAGELGASCSMSSECKSQLCASPNSGRTWECSTRCTTDKSVCPADFECRSNGKEAFCFYAPMPPREPRCGISPGRAAAGGGLVAGFVLAGALARRAARRRGVSLRR